MTAVDISPKAVEVMRKRGVRNARVGELYDEYKSQFDTVLVLLNIGIVGTLEGLDRFLSYLPSLLADKGQLITDSFDPRRIDDAKTQEYQRRKTAQGKYFGERTVRIEYKGQFGEWFEWMHIDPDTLKNHLKKLNLAFEIVKEVENRYLYRIRRSTQ